MLRERLISSLPYSTVLWNCCRDFLRQSGKQELPKLLKHPVVFQRVAWAGATAQADSLHSACGYRCEARASGSAAVRGTGSTGINWYVLCSHTSLSSCCWETATKWGQRKMRVQKKEGIKDGGQKNDMMVERPTEKKATESSISPGAWKERTGRQVSSTSHNASVSFLVLAQLSGS